MSWADRMESYVEELVALGHIRSERVERAFRRVPRHQYIAAYHGRGGRRIDVPQDDVTELPDEVLVSIYSSSVVVTKLDGNRPASSSTCLAVMAEMPEALDLRGGERVLEIGTGTGYNAALLADITGTEVVTVDHAADIVEGARASLRRLGEDRVTVVPGDGFHGHLAAAPYDRVIVTVGAPGVAEPWLDQLGLDVFAVVPVSFAGVHPVLRVERGRPWTAAGRGVCWTDFVAGDGALAHRDERASGSPVDRGPFTFAAPRVVRTFEPALDDHAYQGLTAYVTIVDGRARAGVVDGLDLELGTCVIRDPTGATAAFQRTGVTVDGPDNIAEQILELTNGWLRLGSPQFTDWRFELALQERPGGRFWRPYRWTTAESAHRRDPVPPGQLPTGGHQHR